MLLALALLPLLAAPAARAKEPCAPSTIFATAATEEGWAGRDLDGDGRPDRLRRLPAESGSGGGALELELSLSSLPGPITIGARYFFTDFVAFVPVPKELLGPKRAALRGLVTGALAETVCSEPDPSLEWLLDKAHRLRWRPGTPAMPALYAIVSARREHLALAQEATDEAGERPEARAEAVWILYFGHNHARRSGQEPPAGFAVLARRPGQELWGTAHGVVLVEPEKQRFAWIYVSTPGQKLRWPSVFGARFDGATAVIDQRADVMERRATVRVDLKTGTVRTLACAKDLWDEKTSECPAE